VSADISLDVVQFVTSPVTCSILTDTRRLITEQTVEENLMTSLGGSPPLDIFIRTSGVKRLSGFLQWQVGLLSFISLSPISVHFASISHFNEVVFGIYSSKTLFSPNLFGLLTVLRKHTDSHGRYLLARLRPLGFCAHFTRLPAEGVGTIEQLND
jgi:hypothetical protein